MPESAGRMNEFDLTDPAGKFAAAMDAQDETLAVAAYVTRRLGVKLQIVGVGSFELTEAGAALLRDALARAVEVIGEYKAGTRKLP